METPQEKLQMAHTRLKTLYPAVFGNDVKPLKVGILQDLAERHVGEISTRSLRTILRRHTRSRGYLKAVANGGPRYDLEGAVAGTVTEREAAVAHDLLNGGRPEQISTDEILRRQRALALSSFEKSGLSIDEFAIVSGLDKSRLEQDLLMAKEERDSKISAQS